MDAHLCLQANDTICSEEVSQAEEFADYFSGEYDQEPIPLTYGSDVESQINRPFTVAKFKDAIRCTKISITGADKISATLFKGLNDHSLECLLHIFNIWLTGDIPPAWSPAVILPILKPGKSKNLLPHIV